MIPDNSHKDRKEVFVTFGIRWTPGALKTLLGVLALAAGSGVVGFWEHWVRLLLPVIIFTATLPVPMETGFSRGSVVFVKADYAQVGTEISI